MQLTYAPKAWVAERATWRAVTQLNLIRTVNAILDALAADLASPSPPASSAGEPSPCAPLTVPADRKQAFAKLKLRLAPLRQVEVDLKARLGAGTEEVTEAASHLSLSSDDGHEGLMATPFDGTAYHTSSDSPSSSPSRRRGAHAREIVVRSHKAWKEKVSATRLGGSREREREGRDRDRDRDSATEVLAGCREDMVALWGDAVVREVA